MKMNIRCVSLGVLLFVGTVVADVQQAVDGGALVVEEPQKMNEETTVPTQKTELTQTSVKHHASFEEACDTCNSNCQEECLAGDCSDGSGKFCWACGQAEAPSGFKSCSNTTTTTTTTTSSSSSSQNKKENLIVTQTESTSSSSSSSSSSSAAAAAAHTRKNQCGDNHGPVGPSRDGWCAMANDDTHSVCVNMPTNFCTDTGQDNWCAQGGYEGGRWCICQWAYAHYVESHGCGGIEVIDDSTDICGICAKYTDGNQDLTKAKECLNCDTRNC